MMKTRVKFFRLLIVVVSIYLITGAFTISFTSADTHDTEYDDVEFIRKVEFDSLGNLIIIGNTVNDDAYIAKVDSNMSVIWQEVYGGSEFDVPADLLVDADDNIYVSGITESPNFDTNNAFQPNYGGDKDFYIRKWDTDGNVKWSTYFGGTEDEDTYYTLPSMLLSSENNLIVHGWTNSVNFPTQKAFQTELKGGTSSSSLEFQGDKFVSMFRSDGTLLWSSYFGTSGIDWAQLFLDSQDNIILRGNDRVGDLTDSLTRELKGKRDPFVVKINPQGELVFSTYYGGSGEDYSYWMEIDSQDNLIMIAPSESTDWPVVDPLQSVNGGGFDLTVTKFAPDGTVLWSTYFGGSGNDVRDGGIVSGPNALSFQDRPGMVLDSEDNVIFRTRTDSQDINLLHPNVAERNRDGMVPLVGKIASNGSLLFASYFGGMIIDTQMTLDDEIFLSSMTIVSNWPVSDNAFQNETKGSFDLAYAKLDANGTSLWSSYLGGNGLDRLIKSYPLPNGNFLILGLTTSDNLPMAVNAYQGNQDVMLCQISEEGDVDWCSYIGGNETEDIDGVGLVTNPAGEVFITGVTQSKGFPDDSLETDFQETAFIMSVDQNGNEISGNILLPKARIPAEKESEDPILWIVIISLSSLILLTTVFYKFWNLKIRKSENSLLTQKMSEILSPIFRNQPQLIHIFGATKIFKKDDITDDILSDVPQEIMNFRYFLHPIRMSMLKLLDENIKLTTVQIKDNLGITWSETSTHIDSLKRHGHITIEQQFVDGSMRSVVLVENHTLSQFNTLKEILMEFLNAAPNLDKYLDHVSNIKMRSEDSDLYPNNNS